jgi:ElaB/YqjD/DUF883 family membrane-anchored ribosome-binding protein
MNPDQTLTSAEEVEAKRDAWLDLHAASFKAESEWEAVLHEVDAAYDAVIKTKGQAAQVIDKARKAVNDAEYAYLNASRAHAKATR